MHFSLSDYEFLSYSHSFHFRCDSGSCIRDAAACRLSNSSGYCHGDCLSWRYSDEDAEDVDLASHYLQLNHRCRLYHNQKRVLLNSQGKAMLLILTGCFLLFHFLCCSTTATYLMVILESPSSICFDFFILTYYVNFFIELEMIR